MKSINAILAILLISSVAFSAPLKSSGYLYAEVAKEINGSYKWGLPVLEWSIQQKPFTVDIELRNNFTSPRGNIQIPNHHSSQLEVHLGNQIGQFFWTFSLGGIYHYAQNNDGIPEGLSFKNTLRGGVEFR